MKSLRFNFSSIQDLTPPCYVTISAQYIAYGPTYILMGFDEEKQKYRLISASNPYNKERFVKGDLRVVTGVEFEDI